MGAISGILNGLTDSFVVPGVLYLQALGLARDTLIQVLGVSLCGNRLLSAEYALLSVMGVVPALLGMYVGLGLCKKLNAEQFRRAFFTALIAFGVYLLLNPVLHN